MDKQKQYVNLRLKLAREKLGSAKILLKENRHRDTISRAYYAIYYAAKAFLLHHGQDPYTHKGVNVLFHQFCSSHKKPDVIYAKIFSKMLEARLNAEYKETARLTKNDAQEAIAMAKSFLKEIRSLIK